MACSVPSAAPVEADAAADARPAASASKNGHARAATRRPARRWQSTASCTRRPRRLVAVPWRTRHPDGDRRRGPTAVGADRRPVRRQVRGRRRSARRAAARDARRHRLAQRRSPVVHHRRDISRDGEVARVDDRVGRGPRAGDAAPATADRDRLVGEDGAADRRAVGDARSASPNRCAGERQRAGGRRGRRRWPASSRRRAPSAQRHASRPSARCRCWRRSTSQTGRKRPRRRSPPRAACRTPAPR